MAQSQPELAGQVVGIWGFGREGVSMARTAAAAGAARIEAVDDIGRGQLEVPADIAGVTVFRGSEHLNRLRQCDIVFVSPGVPWRQPVFAELRASGTRISSAADWFVSRHSAQTVGVTGTKGKSTTASFLGHLLGTLGVNAVVAGNIGTPLSDLSPDRDAVVVAELSSQQAALLTTSPAVAVVTNLFQDHLDWHGGTEPYYLAKANVFRNGARSLVSTPEAIAALERIGIHSFPPSLRLVDPTAVRQPEGTSVMTYAHNVVNGALAILAAEEMLGRPVTPEQADAAIATFEGLPHRLQTVRITGRTRWIDDTLATTGESVVAALKAMRPDHHIALIVGGMDRQLNYDQIDAYLCSGARRVSLIQAPSNGTVIGRGFAREHPSDTHVVGGLEEAVRVAAGLPDVDVVLLSPGAASYDLFVNYEAKAAAFCGFIDRL
ncbi:UDP-N-acetylmuramoyl-L-alanine--D-glutamate ligase [Mycobacterium sp. URHB0044]|uniref:UDP-N-acetylmuramoyl-L-alanine--D-glutamate ligase n=1 Tax=Mycobacterium sp. URHB0044 TaxID=1380386 RepID=UPI0004911B27|nr:UDP-N-acetylmuramoyl-L-alanine--D-glutamate ligase [Mycobacterium sp. URHB0044]